MVHKKAPGQSYIFDRQQLTPARPFMASRAKGRSIRARRFSRRPVPSSGTRLRSAGTATIGSLATSVTNTLRWLGGPTPLRPAHGPGNPCVLDQSPIPALVRLATKAWPKGIPMHGHPVHGRDRVRDARCAEEEVSDDSFSPLVPCWTRWDQGVSANRGIGPVPRLWQSQRRWSRKARSSASAARGHAVSSRCNRGSGRSELAIAGDCP